MSSELLPGPTPRRLVGDPKKRDVVTGRAPQLRGAGGKRKAVDPTAGVPLSHVDHPRLRGARAAVKGLIDRTVAALALIAVCPLFLAIVLLVRIDSPGPAIFRQSRVGYRGATFRCWKFRTMHVGAERQAPQLQSRNDCDGLLFKVREDPRVTRVGKVLRRFSLDELPQLINVVRGEMSLVGPRPLPVRPDDFKNELRRRLLVKPGLTGLWQVSGRSDLTWEESVRLDLYYVDNWSLGLDEFIIIRTVAAVIGGSGAY